MADAISYTAATGKRPRQLAMELRWSCAPLHLKSANERSDELASPVWWRLRTVHFRTEAAALKAADDAYLRAVADGAMEPIALASRPEAS